MSDRQPIEARISAMLEAITSDDVPHRVLEAAFDETSTMPQERRGWRGISLPALRGSARMAVIAAAALAIGSVATLLVGGRLASPDSPDLRARVLDAGVLRVAVRADPPQALLPSTGLSGFDIDVARELASRLGVDLDIVTVTAPEAASGGGSAWDISLASLPATALDPAAVTAGRAYYAWPRYLLVPEASAAAGPQDLGGRVVCAVAGDAGETWARASIAGGTATVISRPDDDACLAALDDGTAGAAVTSNIGPADLSVRTQYRSVGGPPPEERVVAARVTDRPRTLLDEVGQLLRSMADDGTLTDLSTSRFGGIDLSTPIVKGG